MNQKVTMLQLQRLRRIRMKTSQYGFTLLEILIALFIFTILSMILVNALHNVINVQSRTERSAERLRNLQMSLVIMSRDIEQTVNRPILNTAGKEEPAFQGTSHGFIFTHTGLANPTGMLAKSALERTQYSWSDHVLSRITWAVLDEAPSSQSHTRQLLTEVDEAHFEYLDKEGRFQNTWPLQGDSSQILPRAVRVYLTIENWGTITQLYVIPAKPSKSVQLPTKS